MVNTLKLIIIMFQVLLNDCATNACLGGEGVVDKLMSIARSMVISNNAQYTRVSTRTCQLIIAITNNNKAVYPYHLNSVRALLLNVELLIYVTHRLLIISIIYR